MEDEKNRFEEEEKNIIERDILYFFLLHCVFHNVNHETIPKL